MSSILRLDSEAEFGDIQFIVWSGRMDFPEHLVITEAYYSLDGGSIDLKGFDSVGNAFKIHLDWSIGSKKNNRTSLFFDEKVVSKRSEDESRLLVLLKDATFQPEIRDDEPGEEKGFSEKRFVGSADIDRVFDAMEEGPDAFLAATAKELISNVESGIHVEGCIYRSIRELIREGVADAREGRWEAAKDMLEHFEIFLTKSEKAHLDRVRRKLEKPKWD